ncbi:Hypothetical protein D9617_54g000270 [Elsinoe fawcettii]|nr:Hypothetical protein D9617_54g000270 [Elsinoe fawcettii]
MSPTQRADVRREVARQTFTVGIICPLEIELSAMKAVLDERYRKLTTHYNDRNSYTFGRLDVHNVVIAGLPDGEYGTVSAASVANDMTLSFPTLKVGILVGVGGGIPSAHHDIRLGDVVVGSSGPSSPAVVQYDLGRKLQNGRFERVGHLNNAPRLLRTALRQFLSDDRMEGSRLPDILADTLATSTSRVERFERPPADSDQLFESTYAHDGDDDCSRCHSGRRVRREGRPDLNPRVHCGVIASGNSVIKHAEQRDLLGQEIDAICFEMEAAGTMSDWPCLVVRGICDYSDSHKNKRWQPFAALTAAAFTKALLEHLSANNLDRQASIVGRYPTVSSKSTQGLGMSALPRTPHEGDGEVHIGTSQIGEPDMEPTRMKDIPAGESHIDPRQTIITSGNISIVWVCSRVIEYAAATKVLDMVCALDPPLHDTDYKYTYGRIGEHGVAIACLRSETSETDSVAHLAIRASNHFGKDCLGLFVGVSGGVPKTQPQLHLGDVVVSTPKNSRGAVIQYDSVRVLSDRPTHTVAAVKSPPQTLLEAVSHLMTEAYIDKHPWRAHLESIEQFPQFKRPPAGKDILFSRDYIHVGGDFCELCDLKNSETRRMKQQPKAPRVFTGSIASGKLPIDDAITRDQISVDLGGVLCFETDAAEVLNNLPSLVVRGISDYADSHKHAGKMWQPYAAAAAAACAKEIILRVPLAKTSLPRVLTDPISARTPRRTASRDSTSHINVPFARNRAFTGRDQELSIIGSRFKPGSASSRIAIYGLGGVGKSACALEYAYREASVSQEPVYWITAISVESFNRSLQDVAARLQLQPTNGKLVDPGTIRARLCEGDLGPFLLIVDNADDEHIYLNHIAPCLPDHPDARIIFTSRDRELASLMADNNTINLEEMDRLDALELLTKHLKDRNLQAASPMMALFLSHIACIPLALVQAAAFMRKCNWTVEQYMHEFGKSADEAAVLLSEAYLAADRPPTSENAIAATWRVSFKHLQEHRPLAAYCLSFAACVSPQAIPLTILPSSPFHQSRIKKLSAVVAMEDFSFLTRRRKPDETVETYFDMHPLVHRVAGDWLKLEGKWHAQVNLACSQLLTKLPERPNYQKMQTWKAYVEHASHVAALPDLPEDRKEELLLRVVRCQNILAQYQAAVKTCRTLIDLQQRSGRPVSSDCLEIYEELGTTMEKLDKMPEAIEIFSQLENLTVSQHGDKSAESVKMRTLRQNSVESQRSYEVYNGTYSRNAEHLRNKVASILGTSGGDQDVRQTVEAAAKKGWQKFLSHTEAAQKAGLRKR